MPNPCVPVEIGTRQKKTAVTPTFVGSAGGSAGVAISATAPWLCAAVFRRLCSEQRLRSMPQTTGQPIRQLAIEVYTLRTHESAARHVDLRTRPSSCPNRSVPNAATTSGSVCSSYEAEKRRSAPTIFLVSLSVSASNL